MDEFCAKLLEMINNDIEFYDGLVGKGCMCDMCHGAQDVAVGLAVVKSGLIGRKYTSVDTGFAIAIKGLDKMLKGQGNTKKAAPLWEQRATYLCIKANVEYIIEQQEKAERAMQSELFARRNYTVH